jgi:hypothetical protein
VSRKAGFRQLESTKDKIRQAQLIRWSKDRKHLSNCLGCGRKLWSGTKRCYSCWKKFNTGDKHWNWGGGLTKLHMLIRNSENYKIWRMELLKRYKYSCSNCGSNKKLEAHHKKQFGVIFRDFLREYSQFSIIEDRETLVRLSSSYQPFWDLSNGEILCRRCHDKTRSGQEKGVY